VNGEGLGGVGVVHELFGEIEAFEDGLIALGSGFLEIIKQSSAFANHLKETTATMVVFFVELEVLGKLGDFFGQESNLNFGASGVAFFDGELGDYRGFLI
jgi:hypothetical protein